jgi:inorganic pyrophosphatase
MNLAVIPHELDPETGVCRAVIETSRHARTKYAYSERLAAFQMKKLLPEGMAFPLDFGFIPATKGGDGDPLDVLVLHDEPIPMGAVVSVRLIGLIEACQTQDGHSARNDRLVAVTTKSQLYSAFDDIEGLGGDFLEHLQQFFVNYNALQQRTFEVIRLCGPDGAIAAVQTGTE